MTVSPKLPDDEKGFQTLARAAPSSVRVLVDRLPPLQDLVWIGLVVSVALNVVQARQRVRSRDLVSQIRSEVGLRSGEQLPVFQAQTLTREPVTVDYGDTTIPTLLYVFTPPCQWCELNSASVRMLAASTKGRVRVLGLSLSEDNLAGYASRHAFSFPVYSISDLVKRAYRLNSTPQTLLVDPDGRLLRLWRGAYQDEIKSDIEAMLRIALPEFPLVPAALQHAPSQLIP